MRDIFFHLFRFTCQLAITEVNYDQIETDIYPAHSQQMHHHPVPPNVRNLNFEFAMDLDSDLRKRRGGIGGSLQHIEAVRMLCQQRGRSASTGQSNSGPRPRSDSACARLVSTREHQSLIEAKPSPQTDMYNTFEQAMHVTNQMETVMAYHYEDENNKGCYRFEEIYTYREGDIDMSSLLEDADCSGNIGTRSLSRARSLSLGHCHMTEELEEFVALRADVVIKEQEHDDLS